MEEVWKEVPGFLDYEVSNLGRVRSFKRTTTRVLSPSSDGRYWGVGLRRNGKSHRWLIGHLVLLAFVGPRPGGMEMCHNDGNSLNDRLTNLRWDTKSANAQDRVVHGRGTKPKLDPAEVYAIRTQFAFGKHSRQELAREFRVALSTIYAVLGGRGVYGGGPGPVQKPRMLLTDQQIEAIRKERASGRSLVNLAEKYGVSASAISLIARGRRHAKVGGPCVQSWEIRCRSEDL